MSVAPCIGQLKGLYVTEVLFKARSKFDSKFHVASIVIYPGEVNVIAEKVELPDHKIQAKRKILAYNIYILNFMNVVQLCH